MSQEDVGRLIKSIDKLMMRNAQLLNGQEIRDKISPMQGWIIGFLFMNQDKIIYQKQIEQEFGLPKSTLASILKQLEEKGYILREAAEHDSRLKSIRLSQEGQSMQCDFFDHIEQINQCMCRGIPEDEIETFFKIGMRLRQNLERNLTR